MSKQKENYTESSDSNTSSDTERTPLVTKLMRELVLGNAKTLETLEEVREVAEPSTRSRDSDAGRLSDEEWSKMTRRQRRSYLRRERETRGGGAENPPKSVSGEKPDERRGKRPRDASNFTPSPNKEVKKKARLDAPQYSQVLKCPKVAITHMDYPNGELKEPLIAGLMEKLVELMREVGPEEEVVWFSGFNIRNNAVVINCGNERSKTWLTESVSKLSPWKGIQIKTCDPKHLEGFKRIGAFIPNPVTSIEAGLANIKTQNKDLDTQRWKILPGGTKRNPKGLYFVASIPESHLKVIEQRCFKINHGFHVIEVKAFKEKEPAKEETTKMDVEKPEPDDVTVDREANELDPRAGGSAAATPGTVTGLDPESAGPGKCLKKVRQVPEDGEKAVTGEGQRGGPAEIASGGKAAATNLDTRDDCGGKPPDPQSR